MWYGQLKNIIYDFLFNIGNRHVPRQVLPVEGVRIFVLQHFLCKLPHTFNDRKIFLPLLCGASGANVSENMISDAKGDNISRYNAYLNEMTGIYWVLKHLDLFSKYEFIGFCHYRRFLEWSSNLLLPGTILATSATFFRPIGKSLCFHLNANNKRYLLERIQGVMNSTEKEAFQEYLKSHRMYPYNMFIADCATLSRYMLFIEKFILLSTKMIDGNEMGLANESATEKRIYGYMLEHMTSFWIYLERKSHRSKVETLFVRCFNVN